MASIAWGLLQQIKVLMCVYIRTEVFLLEPVFVKPVIFLNEVALQFRWAGRTSPNCTAVAGKC